MATGEVLSPGQVIQLYLVGLKLEGGFFPTKNRLVDGLVRCIGLVVQRLHRPLVRCHSVAHRKSSSGALTRTQRVNSRFVPTLAAPKMIRQERDKLFQIIWLRSMV